MNRANHMSRTSFAKTASSLFIITLGVKILSLFREILMASNIGMNQGTDAYNTAILATSLVTGIAGIAIGSSLIPILAGLTAEKSKEDKERFFSNAFFSFMALGLVAAILLSILAGPVIRLLAPGFDSATTRSSIELLQIGFLRVNAVIAATFFTQYLNTKNCFYSPMLASSAGTLLLVGYFLIAGAAANVYSVMIAAVLSDLIQVVWMLPALWRNGFRLKLYLNTSDTDLLMFFSLAAPATFSYAAQQIGTVLNRSLASQLDVGSISAINYASSIVMMINMTISLSIATVLYPRLAQAISMERIQSAVALLKHGVLLACGFLVPAVFGLVILAEDICKVLFERGQFTTGDSLMTATALWGYAVGIIAFALCELSTRFFSSMKDTRTPMAATYTGVIVMITLSILLYRPLGLLGLTLSASAMYTVIAVVLLSKIISRYKQDFSTDLLSSLSHIVIASVLMAIVLLYLGRIETLLASNIFFELALKMVSAVTVYSGVLFVMSVKVRETLKSWNSSE